MIRRLLHIDGWTVHFYFAPDGYDEEELLNLLYDLDASDDILVRASRKIRTRRTNEGFAYSNPYLREAVIVVGPATSGEQYLNSIVHEIHHHSVAIADELGTDLKGEVPAYIAGDTAEVLVDIICMLGCGCRKNGEKVANQKK